MKKNIPSFLKKRIIYFLLLSIFVLGSNSLFSYSQNLTDTFIIADAPWRIGSFTQPIPIFVCINSYVLNAPILLKKIVLRNNLNSLPISTINFDTIINQFPYFYVLQNITGTTIGTLLSPGVADLWVEVYVNVDIIEPSFKQRLQIRILNGVGLPSIGNWYSGDTHFHSDFTDNTLEWGAGLTNGIVKDMGKSIGLDWVFVTDHSTDMDAAKWTEMKQLSQSYSDSSYKIIPAEEITCIHNPSDISESGRRHILSYQVGSHIYGPDGSLTEPLRPLSEVEQELASKGGFFYVAHPIIGESLYEVISNWGLSDYIYYPTLKGLELWNVRAKKKTSFNPGVGIIDPFSWQNDSDSDENLATALSIWDQMLCNYIGFPLKIFIEGGSDAHGDFNYHTIGFPSYEIDDNAFGKVRTYVYAENGLTESNIIDSIKNGRSIITDGPIAIFGIDKNGDGNLTSSDVLLGGTETVPANANVNFLIKWNSTSEFGEINELIIRRGSIDSVNGVPAVIGPFSNLGYSGSMQWTQQASGLSTGNNYYYRIEARIKDNDGNTLFCVYSNPIWVTVTSNTPEMNILQSGSPLASGSTFDFGSNTINTNNDAVFTIQNAGSANLTISGLPLTISGTDADQYSVTAQPASTIAGSGSTSFTVRFRPASAGTKSAHISIGNNDSNENPYVINFTGTGTGTSVSALQVSASPTAVQVNNCSVITATLRDSGGNPLPNVLLTFSTSFPPGIFSGSPSTGCSGPTYSTGNTGVTDANGQVIKYFTPASYGTAIIEVCSETGEAANTSLSVIQPSGSVSAGLYIHSSTTGTYNLDGLVTIGGSVPPMNSEVELTSTVGTFYDNGSPTGSNVYLDYTDGNGELSGNYNSRTLEIGSYTGYVTVTMEYLATGYTTSTTFYAPTLTYGTNLPIVLLRTLTTANRVNTLHWSNDGSRLFAGTYTNKYLYGWDTSSCSQVFLKTSLHHYALTSAVDPTNTKIAVGENGGGIEIFDFSGTQIGSDRDNSNDVSGLDWIGGEMIALVKGSSSTADSIKTHGLYQMTEAGNYSLIRDYDGSNSPQSRLHYNGAKNLFAYFTISPVGSLGATILHVHSGTSPFTTLWDQLLYEPDGDDIDITPNGEQIAIVGGARGAMLINTSGWNIFQIVDTNIYETVCFLGNTGRVAMSTPSSGLIRIFDQSGKVVSEITAGAAVDSMAYEPTNQLLAVGLSDGNVKIYGIDSQAPQISNTSVTPETYSIGTIFTISADLTDALSGINDASAKAYVRDASNNIVATITLVRGSGDNFSGQWDSSGASATLYHVGIYVEDNAANVAEQTAIKYLNFVPPAIYYPLYVQSTPSSGVPITISPVDKDGNGSGNTFLTRTYIEGAVVTLTAPSDFEGNSFAKWNVGGSDFTTQTIQVTMDAAKTATAVYPIPDTITLTSPIGSENWTVGDSHNITWTSTGTITNVNIDLSTDSGSSWNSVASNEGNDGSYTWTVPNAPAATCLVRVSDTDGDPSDQSDVVFTIVLPSSLTISGTISDGVNPMQGVSVCFGGDIAPVQTDASGQYSQQVPYGFNGWVFPYKLDYTFIPARIDLTNITGDTTGQDFAGTLSPLASHTWAVATNDFGRNIYTIDLAANPPAVLGPFLTGSLGTTGDTDEVAITPDKRYALISNFSNNTVYRVDLSDPTWLPAPASLNIGFHPEDIDIARNGTFAVVTGGGNSNKIAFIALPDFSLTGSYTMEGDHQAQACSIADDNRSVILADNNHSRIIVGKVNSTGNGLVSEATFATSGNPVNISISPNGRVLLVANGSNDQIDVFHVSEAGEVTACSPVTGLPGSSQSIAFSPDGSKAYVVSASPSPDAFSWLQISGDSVSLGGTGVASLAADVGNIFVGMDTLAVTPDGQYALASNMSDHGSPSHNLTLIDSNNFVTSVLATGSPYYPLGIAIACAVPDYLNVISPNGGESLNAGSSQDITWSSNRVTGDVNIDYSTDSGGNWTPVAAGTENDGIYAWTVPNTPSTNCLVRVSDSDGTPNDTSNALFTIIVSTEEAISAPTTPTGPSSGAITTSYDFSTSGSTSSLGHSVQYKFDWDDGPDSGWLAVGTTTASHSWTAAGTYDVRAMARCAADTAIESSWSTPLAVIITDGSTTIYYNSSAQYKVLPEVIWANATGGGTWMSSVQVTDITGGSQVSVYYNTAAGRRGPFLLWDNSAGPALSSIKYSNLLETIDALDTEAFTYYGTVGAVEFFTQDGSHLLHAAARTVNGNYAKTFTAVSLHDANTAIVGRSMIIPNLVNNATYRSTCGLFNPTSDSVMMDIKLLNATNTQVGNTISLTLPEHAFTSMNPFTEAGVPYPGTASDNCVLKIQPTSGTGKVVCFGASANNASNDPAAHVAIQNTSGIYDNGPGNQQVMPEAVWATASGGGTWVTEVQIVDATGGSQVSVYFNYSGGVRRGPFTLWTGTSAGSKVKYSNILEQLGTLDGIYTYYGKGGTVEFMTQDGSHNIQVTARTLNGNYSKTFPGLNPADAETADTTRTMLIQNYTNNSTYRSTCGFYNPTADSITVEYTLLNGSGAQIGSSFSKTLVGHDFVSFSPFAEAGVPYPGNSYDNVILRVRPTSGTGSVMCFGASANNASNDPASHLAVQTE